MVEILVINNNTVNDLCAGSTKVPDQKGPAGMTQSVQLIDHCLPVVRNLVMRKTIAIEVGLQQGIVSIPLRSEGQAYRAGIEEMDTPPTSVQWQMRMAHTNKLGITGAKQLFDSLVGHFRRNSRAVIQSR